MKQVATLIWTSLLLLALLAAPAWSTQAAAEVITGRVVSVADGDTITVLVAGNRQVKIRLADVDTPERGQPWGKRAKQATSALVFGRQVTVQMLKKDKYKRWVGRVTVEGKNVGQELVAAGDAWVYRKYSRDQELIALEQQARDQNRGLWALPAAQRVAPWDWRRLKRERSKQARAAAAAAVGDTTCGVKQYCRQMINCREARFYLTQCGIATLDGNSDGTPCNRLCR